ncbi:hypothetical protein HKW80_15215 [Pseudomonas aeruginosa]|nr:hypothetical protein [Pseudomonas aeruginosa]
MRALLAFALLLVGLPALADPYQRLYQAAGWPDQRAHFSDALDAAQKRYQDKLPPALYQTLVDNSNRRFAPAEVDQRALNGLRENLPDSASPLNFFESPLGRKVVAAEVLANRIIRNEVVKAAQKVREGASLTRSLEATGQFPPMMLHMIASGERSGELDQMLARTARNQENDLAAQIGLMVGLFEPFMLIFMGAVVLVIVLAILLPILSLNQLVG